MVEMDSDVFKIKPIGVVRNNVKESIFRGWKDIVSNLEINDDFMDGLSGLEDYSHITVIYWLNLVDSCTLTHRPQGKQDVPEVGIFACRCPTRPNPLGISTAKLLRREKNSLSVKGLDALDGTPIIDIKPYTPQYDLYSDVIVPEWVNNLEY
jgi:tRNA-Thr(GGU) m(6)t(6)A37 methyltransferase TsaA